MDLGMPEIIVIVVIALVLFGPSKLPGLGKSMGEAIRGFKKGMKDGDDTQPTPPPFANSTAPIVTPVRKPDPQLTHEPKTQVSQNEPIAEKQEAKVPRTDES